MLSENSINFTIKKKKISFEEGKFFVLFLKGINQCRTFFTALKRRGDACAWKPATTVMWKLQILFDGQSAKVYKQEESV